MFLLNFPVFLNLTFIFHQTRAYKTQSRNLCFMKLYNLIFLTIQTIYGALF
jgi:hypothetical protein